MTEYNIDWSKAPEGCNMVFILDYDNWENGVPFNDTHWEKLENGEIYDWRGDEWRYWETVAKVDMGARVKKIEVNDFIEWKGGEQPVPNGTMVHVKYRDGEEAICTAGIEYWNEDFKRLLGDRTAISWSNSKSAATIVAYKLYKEPSTQGEVVVSPEVESVSTEAVESHTYKAGDDVTVVDDQSCHGFRIGGTATLIYNIETNVWLARQLETAPYGYAITEREFKPLKSVKLEEVVVKHKYNIGDEVRIVSEKHSHRYEIGQIVTLTGFTSVEDNSQYGEDYWHTDEDGACWHIVESEFEPYENYEEEDVKPLELVDFGAIADEPITTVGATLDADIVINIGHQNYLVSVKQARKLYKDLKSIFKEQLR